MKHLVQRIGMALSLLIMGSSSVWAQSDLIITGVMDGPLSGGYPKIVELYVINDVADASAYNLNRYSNGGTSASSFFTFPAIALTAGSFYTVTQDDASHVSFFGGSADAVAGISINGDDGVELALNGTAVDIFGLIGQDGTNTCWDYLDGWAYRNNNSSPTTTFNCADWTFSGINALDNETSNATAVTPFPTASFTTGGVVATPDHFVVNIGTSFSPAALQIAVGDSVLWTLSGNHNVNGSQSTYPNNPESFYSGPAPQTSFGHRFMTSGLYTYRCDPHVGLGMIGTIEVQGALNAVSSLAISANGEDEVNVSWTKPSGVNGVDWDGVMVFMSESPFSNFFTNNAQEASNYTGNFSYMGGTMVSADGTNNGYCIYNSTANTDGNIDIDGLTANTLYYVTAYAYRTVAASDDEVSFESSAFGATDAPPTSSDLMIVGSMDGPLTGGHPKVVELYAVNAVADASEYTVELFGNGSPTSTATVHTLPAMSMNAGDRYYITGDSTGFYTFFGFAADAIGSTFLNGDDALGLTRNGVLVDAMGQIGVDGTGECWEWLDGWGYRSNGGAPSTLFNCADWSWSGINAMDGETSNATAAVPYPIGTYGIVATVDLEITEVMAVSAHSNTAVDGDWFEIRNNGATPIDLSGFSWSNGSQTPGTHTFGSIILPSGQSMIVLNEDSADIITWTNEWNQTANNIRVVARNMFGNMGFTDLNSSADGVYLYDASNNLVNNAVYASSAAGFSLEFNAGLPAQAVNGVNGAYTSNGGDVASPADVAPFVLIIPNYNIADVRGVDANGVSDSDGVYVRLHGVVTSVDFDGNAGYSFFMTDGTQGINVFSFVDVDAYTVNMGDSIRVVGTIDQFRGLIEIIPDSIVLLASGLTVPAPMAATNLDEATESELITFAGVSLVDPTQWPASQTSTNVDFVTAMGDTLQMRIDFDVAIFGSAPTGTFNLTGIGNQYSSTSSAPFLDGYQIFPRGWMDIDTNVSTCADYGQRANVVGIYRVNFLWNDQGIGSYNLHFRKVGDANWTTLLVSDTNRVVDNREPGDYEYYLSEVGGGNATCVGNFTIACASNISYTYNVFQAPELGRLGRARVFQVTGGKRRYDIYLVNSNGDTTAALDRRQENFTDLADDSYMIYVRDAFGCAADSIGAFTIQALDTSYVPNLISAVNSSPNGFRPIWNSVDGVINYQLRILNVTDGTLENFITGINDTLYHVNNLTPGKLYRFNVRSRYNDGIQNTISGYSNPVSRNLPIAGNKNDESTSASAASAVHVYPNPATDEIRVMAPNAQRIELVDLNGRIMLSVNASATETRIALNELAQGVYLVRVHTSENISTTRIVVQ